MRIHIQNSPGDGDFAVTETQWQDALSRAGQGPFDVSFANDQAGLEAGLADAVALVVPVSQIKGRFPIPAPSLKMIFCLSAGLDGLAPFDWLPPGVALLNNRGAHGAKAGEYGIMALLMLAARMPEFFRAQREAHGSSSMAACCAGGG